MTKPRPEGSRKTIFKFDPRPLSLFSKGLAETAPEITWGSRLATTLEPFLQSTGHSTVLYLVAWPLNRSEAEGDLVLLQTCSNMSKPVHGHVPKGRDLKQWRRRRQKNHAKKNEFAFFQSYSHLFGSAQYVKCRRLFLELNSWGFYTGSKRWREIRRSMSMSSIKRQIRRFHVVVVQ